MSDDEVPLGRMFIDDEMRNVVSQVLDSGRWIAVELGPLLRQYWFASDLEEKPFSRVTREWIYATSKGKKNTIGFGSQVDFDAVGTCTVMPSMFNSSDDSATYSRSIGKSSGVTNVVNMEHFVNISAM